jgi:hypothetical protein
MPKNDERVGIQKGVFLAYMKLLTQTYLNLKTLMEETI